MDNRHMLNAMLWVARSGASWRDLTRHLPNWKSVYTRFWRWQEAGIWDGVIQQIPLDFDEESVWKCQFWCRRHYVNTIGEEGSRGVYPRQINGRE